MGHLFQKSYQLVKRHPIYTVLIALCMLLAYGFYATHYTYHIDQLVDEYYSGTALITAGRFVAPLIHFFTNWMTFSPFWHTALMCILLFCGGLAWATLFARASADALSDESLCFFMLVFTTSPVLAYQLTYPILNIALAYVLIPMALWLLFYGEATSPTQKWKHRILAAILTMLAVDMYESFASVFLIGLFAILLLHQLFVEKKRPLLESCKQVLVAAALLLSAIVLDHLLSRLVCFIASGSFDFWYAVNTQVLWGQIPLFDGIIWFVRTLFGYFLLGHVQNLFVFLLFWSCLLGLVLSIVLAIRRKSWSILLLYAGLLCAVFSLAFVLGYVPEPRMMQGAAVFIGVIVLLLWQFCRKKKHLRTILACLLCILCLLQTQFINNYSVENYERHEYETGILQQMASQLNKYSIDEKPVAFILCGEFELPSALTDREQTNPIFNGYCRVWYAVCDLLTPARFFEHLSGWYNTDIENTEGLISALDRITSANKHSFLNHEANTIHYKPEIYRAIQRMGTKLIRCTPERYEIAKETASVITFDIGETFQIVEETDLIIVYIAGTNA